MNRAALALSFLALACCFGIPLLLGGAGLSVIAALTGRYWVAIVLFIVVVVAIALYAYAQKPASGKPNP